MHGARADDGNLGLGTDATLRSDLEATRATATRLARQLEAAERLGARSLDAEVRAERLVDELRAAELELSRAIDRVHQLEEQLDHIRSTSSWRLTRPVRRASDLVRRLRRQTVTDQPS